MGDEVVCLPPPDTDPDIHLLSEPGEPITSQPDHNKWPLKSSLNQEKRNNSTKSEIALQSDRKPHPARWLVAEHEGETSHQHTLSD